MLKISHALMLGLVFSVSAQSFAAPKAALKSPQAGVLCDKYICADQNGLSKPLTTKYLGAAKAKNISSGEDFDSTRFTFANGIFCDTNTRLCHVDRYFSEGKPSAVSKTYTAKLFGK
ncbi:Fels-1 prophage protein [Acinetobacter calcoaceticus]|uniref:Fels-1 prophage protein n=1 Tax=Acinetobacter calcoaceticus TaxID=471 RepID=A0A4R1XQK8_ACICA|nr:Fels-1 prophage protein [Acinetobacter calcoaceticus]